ncbi:MAG: PAS domain-containing protein [Rhodospirillaceae bacterium]|nr:PAS domain-containing protein [Rhodospirillaceae bacterium]
MFKTTEAMRFFAAWQTLRTRDELPHYRTVFQGIPNDLLPQLLIIEHVSDDAYTVRFMGTRTAEFWGQDLTGQDCFAAVSPRIATAGRRNLRTVLSHPCGIVTWGLFTLKSRGEIGMENVILPVSNDPGKPLRILGFGQEMRPPLPEGDDRPDMAQRRWIDLGFGVPAAKPAQ